MEEFGKFGLYLVTSGFVEETALAQACKVQAQFPFLKIGEILVSQGAISFNCLVESLREYRAQCRLGQLLVLEGSITLAQLEEALMLQASTGLLLGKVLIDLKACTLEQVMHGLSLQRRMPMAA